MGTDTIASPKIQANTTRLPQPQDEASPFIYPKRPESFLIQDHVPPVHDLPPKTMRS
jgi:hypothetical protein